MGQRASKAAASVASKQVSKPKPPSGVQSVAKVVASNDNSPNTDMPADMMDFLTDAGPLKKPKDAPRRLHTIEDNVFVDGTRTTEPHRLADNVEGFNTTRTSSFSTTVEEEVPGLDVVDLFRYLRDGTTVNGVDPQQLERLRATVQLPVLMRDTDESFVGAPADQLDQLQLRGLEAISKESVQWVLEDLAETER